MNDVSPEQVLHEVAISVPPEFLQNIVVTGSLAAGYYYFKDKPSLQVRTKDIDCILYPHLVAVEAAGTITRHLIETGWTQRREGDFGIPGTAATPDHELPAVRLYPPSSQAWFVEFLAAADTEGIRGTWTRVRLPAGHYGIPSFPYLTIATHNPIMTHLRLKCARPEMMALANLLEHPMIGEQRMSSLFAGRSIKRSNKDLGRVLALARLGGDDTEYWAGAWQSALEACYPGKWRGLASGTGRGLRALLDSPDDLREAYFSCANGLLAHYVTTEHQLRVTGLRLLQDAIEPLERMARINQ